MTLNLQTSRGSRDGAQDYEIIIGFSIPRIFPHVQDWVCKQDYSVATLEHLVSVSFSAYQYII